MGNVVLNGGTSGQITLQPTAVAGTNTLTLPAATDTLVGKATTDTLTNKTLTSPIITGASMSSMASSVITVATAQASTSGTSIDFTSVPSWVKRITIMFSGVSTSGGSTQIVQLGTGGTPTYTTSGYLGSAMVTTGATVTNFSAGFMYNNSVAATQIYHGMMTLVNITGNTWCEQSILGDSSSGALRYGAGSIALASTLTAVRITTSGGSETFDAGTINIMYE